MGSCSIGTSIQALSKMERNFTEAYRVLLKTVQTAPVIHGCMTTLAPNSRTTGAGYIYS